MTSLLRERDVLAGLHRDLQVVLAEVLIMWRGSENPAVGRRLAGLWHRLSEADEAVVETLRYLKET